MSDLKNFEVDQVIVPGDVINFGPFSRRTAEIVIENGWPVIRGNNEYFLLDYNTPRAPVEWNDPVQFAPNAWLDKQFDQKLKNIIGTWPDALNLRFRDAPPIEVFHGTPQSPWDSIYWNSTDEEIENILSKIEADFVICGHTHLPLDRQSGRWRIFNPGSVGVPLDGIYSASYMILEGDQDGWNATFRRIPFDYKADYQEFETSGFNRECGPIGRLVLEIYKIARPTFGFLKWHQKLHPNLALSHELVEEYFSSCEWWEFAEPAYHINMT